MTITLTREEAQQVLDAFVSARGYIFYNVLDDKENQYDAAIKTLRARLAQPEPERCKHGVWAADHCYECEKEPEPVAVFDEQLGRPVLLSHAPMLKDEQPLYTAPPQREWQGLTDEEMADAWVRSKGDVLLRLKPFARAIEAKLKAKNS